MSKKYLLIVIPLLAAIYVAKHFYAKNKLQAYFGTTTALKNGVSWSARCSAKASYPNKQRVAISINRFDNEQSSHENLSFYNIPLNVGKHPLSGMASDSLPGAFFGANVKFDLIDFYKLAQNDSSSYLEITGYDAEKSEIKGRFSLTLWHPTNTPLSAGAPDSLVISEGVFKGRLEAWPHRVGQNGE